MNERRDAVNADGAPTGREARSVFRTGDYKAYRPLDMDELHARYGITQREAQVARHLARGLSNLEVATVLKISVHTVRRHVEHVLMRLRVKRRTEVAARLLVTKQ